MVKQKVKTAIYIDIHTSIKKLIAKASKMHVPFELTEVC